MTLQRGVPAPASPDRRDRGAASTEWAGTLLIGALLIGLITAALLSVAPGGIGTKVRIAVCQILNLGQGDCGSAPEAVDRTPKTPCVVNSYGASLNRNIGVVVVRIDGNNAFEIAQMSDGRYRVTEYKGGAAGAEVGVGGGVTLTVNDRTFGGSATANASALLGLKAGRVWYTDDPRVAEQLVNEAKEEGAEDTVLGDGPGRWLWERGQDAVGAITGNGDHEFPPPDEVIVEGGVIVNASAEATGLPSTARAGISGTTALGTKITKDGKVTVYLKTKVNAELYAQQLMGTPGELDLDLVGGKAAGSIEILTEATFDSAGNLVGLAATTTATYDTYGVAAAIFGGDPNSISLSNQNNGAVVLKANLPIRSDADRQVAADFFSSLGVTGLSGAGGPLILPGAEPGVPNPAEGVSNFLDLARDNGEFTQQTYSTSGGTLFGASAAGKLGVELSGGVSVQETEQQTTGAKYWDGTRWVPWEACS